MPKNNNALPMINNSLAITRKKSLILISDISNSKNNEK
jgi:hypothetical protein